MTPLLDVEELSVSFNTEHGPVQAVRDVSFTLNSGETLGLVGESGCGKSVTAQSIMRLLPSPPSFIEGGSIKFDGKDLVHLSDRQMQGVRGSQIGMVFQEPMTSLNPTQRIGRQIAEVLALHRDTSYGNAKVDVVKVLRKAGIGNAERRLDQYPHELSGGLRQRVMIAMAIVCAPKLLIADEPTTALDVTIQAQIMELLTSLQRELGLAMLLITHDLGVVASVCQNLAVMYAGRIVEIGPTRQLLERPRHPYTAGLLGSSPRKVKKGQRLHSIPGQVPLLGQGRLGCSFAERCSRSLERCQTDLPQLTFHAGHGAACWNPVS